MWVPAPLAADTPYQKTITTTFKAEGGTAKLVLDKTLDSVAVVAAEYPAGVKPVLTVTSRASTRNYDVDLAVAERDAEAGPRRPGPFPPSHQAAPHRRRRPRPARVIAGAARTDEDKARAIYDWIVENTFRDAKVRGCGRGDIRSMLETGNLGGKCADLNALYVGLARASGLPARDVYGIRTVKSELGFKCLGPATPTITKAQHCRAEVYLSALGWVPVDPADVRKVALEEPPGNRTLEDAVVKKARARLFGSWEMNWMAYNFGHDVSLPGAGQVRWTS